MTYNLFISHSWAYSDAYEKLVNMLNAKPYFDYKNYSVPKTDLYIMHLMHISLKKLSESKCNLQVAY